MADLVLLDDGIAREFSPFSLTRPVSELRAGALLQRERWERASGARAIGFIGAPHLKDFDEPGATQSASGTIKKGTIVANSRCVVALPKKALPAADVWRCASQVAAVKLQSDVSVSDLGASSLDSFAKSGAKGAKIDGRWLENVWDLVVPLSEILNSDIVALSSRAKRYHMPKMIRGKHAVFVEAGATVEPQVFFDTSSGPVLIRKGATVLAFTRIVGPCVIGEGSSAGGDRIAVSSIGDHCKVHGEMNSTVLLGYSNKGHDGFVGHSYLGRWVNLGAGTITSNLKNTYGPVQLSTPAGLKETGAQFLGSFFGDHAKTGIGMRLTTGTVIGAGANIYGSGMPSKNVAPFAWGEHPSYSIYRMDKFLEVAKRVMARRHVELTDRAIRQLTAAHATSTQKP
jgi:UDP-N-acetylglucosamine diphosphorylase/glucosamine-1-phosphate N-acetyltransferase